MIAGDRPQALTPHLVEKLESSLEVVAAEVQDRL